MVNAVNNLQQSHWVEHTCGMTKMIKILAKSKAWREVSLEGSTIIFGAAQTPSDSGLYNTKQLDSFSIFHTVYMHDRQTDTLSLI